MNRDTDTAHNLLGTKSSTPSRSYTTASRSDDSSSCCPSNPSDSPDMDVLESMFNSGLDPKSKPGLGTNKPNPLLERKKKLIADLTTYYLNLIHKATEQIPANASNSSAAINRLAMETAMTGFISATEDLLSLTREIRELWIIGSLTKPGAGDEEARQSIKQEADETFDMVNALRHEQRLAQIGAADQSPMTYQVKSLEGHPGRTQQ
ncbi:hypothetical protein QBC41DRAFT_253115 [Cercophora samala]|uniref:Uncharacterized protein n=1 Tax=Cercophora samala TaxID=330535 RepID=A0AA40DBH3_9PEZI|nr:hypothetical protein QBC41DRAFT_253115 [Cercophora samala]